MIRRPPRSTLSSSSAASDVYKRQVPIMKGNDYVPLVANVQFVRVPQAVGNNFESCLKANRSKCFNLTVDGEPIWPEPLPSQRFGCKRVARTMWGTVDLPWGVCIPLDAPVNLREDYPNWGPTEGEHASLVECNADCQ
eukprot:TRINITY_DN55430_c0_g1_i1.p1 TRINITY_DN55430_c0_g1~~TRINITY_DN55430_c0_g1_i1.p1  ORF type:complete len:138 (+),score=21.09 TRINITY_DN55430_c0_g1_i1:55-468(+)